MRRWFAHALETLWLTTACVVPLAFNPWGHSAFELPKAILLRALILLMCLATLAQAVENRSQPKHTPPRQPIILMLWPALALGLTYALATTLSVNPCVSLWGSYERQQGLLTHGAYLALFLLTAANLHSHAQVERLWRMLVWGSAPVVVYGLVQAAGLDPLDWSTDAASPVLSTIGRANFLGSYLVLVIPLTARQTLLARCRWPHGVLLAGQLVCLAFTRARGAWMGLGATAITALLAWSAATRDRRPLAVALTLTVLVVGFVVALNLPGGPLEPLAQIPGLDRLATLGRTDAGSTATRLTIWRATLPLVAARPWLGYGPETMEPVFAQVFPPELVYYQGRHVAVDRAHNLWLDLGMSAGLMGIVSYCALLTVLGVLFWRGLRCANSHQRRITWTALAAAIVGHLVDLQFGFDLTASATVFWLILALGAAKVRDEFLSNPHSVDRERQGLEGQFIPHLPPALVVLALIGLICLRPLLADFAYWKSQQGGRPPVERLTAAKKAVHLWPLEPEYRLGLAWALGQEGHLAAAEIQLDAAERLGPDDPSFWAARGEIYARWGDTEPKRYFQAEMAYRRALELAPNVAAYHTALGLILAQQGRLEAGVTELERAVALDATDGVAYGHLAELYEALGRSAQARQARQEAERWSIHKIDQQMSE